MTHTMETRYPAEDEIVFVRIFDAPRDLVWRAWTDPQLLRQWWGPHDFDAPDCEIELKPGGAYRIVARGPDATRYPVKGVYLEIVDRERLVMTDNSEEMPRFWREAYARRRKTNPGEPPAEIILTLSLEDAGDGTRMTLSSRFATPADRAASLAMGSEETWRQSFEKLGAILEEDEPQ